MNRQVTHMDTYRTDPICLTDSKSQLISVGEVDRNQDSLVVIFRSLFLWNSLQMIARLIRPYWTKILYTLWLLFFFQWRKKKNLEVSIDVHARTVCKKPSLIVLSLHWNLKMTFNQFTTWTDRTKLSSVLFDSFFKNIVHAREAHSAVRTKININHKVLLM